MKIVVISPRSSDARRLDIRRQFEAIDVPFEIVDAIDRDSSLAHIHHFDGREFFLNTGRAATAREIAHYASHVAAWRQCVDDDDAMIILGDDVRLGLAFRDGLFEAAKAVHRYGIIRITAPVTDASLKVEELRSFSLRYCRRVPRCAMGYAISPEAAMRLANNATIVEQPIEQFISRFWRHGQAIYALRPAIVFPRNDGAPPAARGGAKFRSMPGISPARIRRKLDDAVSRVRFNLALYAAMAFPVLVAKLEFLQFAGRRAG